MYKIHLSECIYYVVQVCLLGLIGKRAARKKEENNENKNAKCTRMGKAT